MNAIALLSGWGHQRDAHTAPRRRASLSPHNDDGGDEDAARDGEQDKQAGGSSNDMHESYPVGTAALQEEIDGPYAEESQQQLPDASSSSTSTAAVLQADSDLARILKPPEAVGYEALEEAVSPGVVDPASVYPTPPASRTSTPPDAVDEAVRRQDSNSTETGSSSSSNNHLSPPPSNPSSRFHGKLFRRQPSSSHDEQVRTSSQQQRRLSDRQTRALARSFPVRCIARIYMLLRRFFALFGIRIQPVPALTNTPEVQSLQCPVLAIPPIEASEEAPPSYNDAVKPFPSVETGEKAVSPTKQSRWKIASLLNRNNSSDYLTDKDGPSTTTEGYASTSSDDWTVSEEKKALRQVTPSAGPMPSISDPPRGHHSKSTPSVKASVAQLALSKPKLLVLDLDETLIHSTSRMSYASNAVTSSVDGRPTYNANTSGLKVRVVEVVLDGRSVIYHVYKRPWVDFFLRKVSSWYTVVIFTASLQEYADPVIDWLDQGRGMISTRLFRESCTYVNGSYVKDLSIVDKDLARVCLVDNSPVSYAIDPGKRDIS